MTGCEGARSPLRCHLPGAQQQRLGEELERAGDDDGDGGRHLAHIVVALHDLLDACLAIFTLHLQLGSLLYPSYCTVKYLLYLRFA